MEEGRLLPAPSWRGVVVGGAAASTLAAGLAVLAWVYGESWVPTTVFDILFALVWSVVGLVAWRLRPGSRIGPLMVVMGAVSFAAAPAWFGFHTDAPLRSLVTMVSLLGMSLQPPVAAHLLLSYPSGRLQDRPARGLVLVAYASAVAQTVLPLMLFVNGDETFVPAHGDCGDRCPVSPISIWPNPDLYVSVQQGFTAWGLVLILATLALVVRRHRGMTPRSRRTYRVALVPAVAVVVVTAADYVVTLYSAEAAVPLVYGALFLSLLAVPAAFLVGLLQERLAYASAADLARQVEDCEPAEVQTALAHALGDPGLRVLFPLGDGYVGADGSPASLPADARAVTVLGAASAPTAVLVHDVELAERSDLLQAAGAAARLSLDNARQRAEISSRIDEMRSLRRRGATLADAERRRLERNLHDGAQQQLMAVGFSLDAVRGRVADAETAALLVRAGGELREALTELRALARGSYPLALTTAGLAVAVLDLAGRLPLPITVSASLDARLPRDIEVTAYFVIAEALQNIVKHSAARSARVDIDRQSDTLVVQIEDDGVGGADLALGSGLQGLVDRVAAFEGGRLDVASPPGAGTRITARLSCD